MATFIIDDNGNKIYQKLYEDRNYLETEFLTLKRTAKQIARDNNVSYKLINTWLIKLGLIDRTSDVKTVW